MLNFKQDRIPQEIPPWLINKPDASLMLWAGDCVHDGVTDIERLPGYDVYLCCGFDGLAANINVSKARPTCICIIDVHDQEQLNSFTELFQNKFQTINSDYHGNTPKLPMQAYCDLLKVGGNAYNTEGINSLFFPTIAFRDTIELFAPVLPDYLKPRRKWTKSMLDLARDNELTVEGTWTSPDLVIPYYEEIRKEQTYFDEYRAKRYPSQNFYFMTHTAENIEEYWDTLPECVFLANITRAFIMEGCDTEWADMFIPRLIKYLEKKVEMRMEEDLQHFLAFYATRSLSNETQLFALQMALKAIALSKEALPSLKSSIQFYKDLRIKDMEGENPKMIFGVIFTKV